MGALIGGWAFKKYFGGGGWALIRGGRIRYLGYLYSTST